MRACPAGRKARRREPARHGVRAAWRARGGRPVGASFLPCRCVREKNIWHPFFACTVSSGWSIHLPLHLYALHLLAARGPAGGCTTRKGLPAKERTFGCRDALRWGGLP